MRSAPLGQLTRRYVAEGAIGRPEHVLATNYVPYGTCFFDTYTYQSFQHTHGLFTQKATHDFDCMQFVVDSPIVRVAAMASYGRVFGGNKRSGLKCSECDETETCLESPINRRMNGSDPGEGGVMNAPGDHLCPFSVDVGTPETGMNDDSSTTLVEFASGAQGCYTQVVFTRRDAGARHHIYSGYHGTLQLDWYKNEVRRVRHHEPFTGVTAVGGNSHALGDYALVRNFLDIIKGKDSSRCTIQDGLRSIYVCLAAQESTLTHQFVNVRQVGETPLPATGA